MAPGEEQDILIFYHIPKTGGTTVTLLLNPHFSPESICPELFYYEIESKPFEYLMNYKFIRGHFFYNSNLQSIKNAKRICFLRDPVERILSEQRYLEQYHKHAPQIVFRGHFLPRGNPVYTAINQQCLFLSGHNRYDPKISSAMHLESAKYNLENGFFFVGITEKMDESLEVLYTLFGWDVLPTVPRNNTTIETGTRNPILIESIKRRNWADIELYEFAKKLFEKKRNQVML